MTKSHCRECQASRTINRYESGAIYSVVTRHEPKCPRVAGRGTSAQLTGGAHVLGPVQTDG